MIPELETFLVDLQPEVREEDAWEELRLTVTSYLTQHLPPTALITSVRAVAFKDDHVLAIREPHFVHILPGGRVEDGESFMDTLTRELLEETGWTVRDPRQLGFMHFHHTTPKRKGCKYPYPDFLQLVYMVEAEERNSSARIDGDYVIDCSLVPILDTRALNLSEAQNLFLSTALELR